MPSAEGTNRGARCMQPPRVEQPALTLKTLFTNLETFVTFFLCVVFGNKNRGALVAASFCFVFVSFLKKAFPVATFVCFALFFSTRGSGRQRILEKSRRWEFFLINEIYVGTYEYSIAQVSGLSFPRGAADDLVTGSMGSVCMK